MYVLYIVLGGRGAAEGVAVRAHKREGPRGAGKGGGPSPADLRTILRLWISEGLTQAES